MLDTVLAISLALGLAAACGFRVFVPMAILGIATRAGLLTLADGFEWIGSWPAIATFATATLLEIAAYYLPWLDNFLDSISAPAAVVAGVIVTAACVYDVHPLMKWSLAVIAGGGAAGSVKAGLTGIRLGSTAATGGAANPLVSTVEWMASMVMSILSVFLPILAAVLAIILIVLLFRFAVRVFVRLLKGNREPTCN